MIRIGIFGGGANVYKMAKLLSKNLEKKQGVIIEVLLPEGRSIFSYDENNILDSISSNELKIFDNNRKKIQDFMNEFSNVVIRKDVRITEYYEVDKKHVVNMYTSEQEESVSSEYDSFVYADKILTVSSTLNSVSSDHSLVNIASIHEFDKVEWLFGRTNAWEKAESIVLVGNDLKTYKFAISLRQTFKDLDITIINVNKFHDKPLKGYTFDYVSDALLRRVKSMGIKVHLKSKIVERVIDFDTDLVSSITVQSVEDAIRTKINTEIILVIDNVDLDDVICSNSYLIKRISTLSGADNFPIVNTNDYFEVENLNNFYFINSLAYRLVNMEEYTVNQKKMYNQRYEVERSYTHIFAVVSSILAWIDGEEKIKIPINKKLMEIDNTTLNIEGIVEDDLRDKVFFVNGGNNVKLLGEKEITIVKTGILSKENTRVNLAVFVDKNTHIVENFLLEVKMINFNKKDSYEVYLNKIENVYKVKEEMTNFLYSFKLGKVGIIDLLIKMIDIFDERYIYKINNLIFNTKRKIKETPVLETCSEDHHPEIEIEKVSYNSELNIQKLPSFEFDKTTVIDRNMLMKKIEEGVEDEK